MRSVSAVGPVLARGEGGWRDLVESLNELYRRILMLPEQGSSIARSIDYLHYLEITVMNAVAFVIAFTALYFVVRYRRRPGSATPPRIKPRLSFELGVIAGLFAFFILFWVIGFRQYIELLEAPEDALDVYVVGKQWMWKFTYPEGPASVGILYVPTGRPVRLHLTSRDVIHSFFVPEFRIKRDAVPGIFTTTWFEAVRPGVYQGFCAELCGVGHSRMRAMVVALGPEEYEAWLRSRPPLVEERPGAVPPNITEPTLLGDLQGLALLGREVAARHGCLRCHSTDGSAHIGPTWLDLYGARETLADGEQVLVNEAFITRYIMDPDLNRVAGFEPVMPSFMGQITPAEIAAVIEFMKALSTTPGVRGEDGAEGERRQEFVPRPGGRPETGGGGEEGR